MFLGTKVLVTGYIRVLQRVLLRSFINFVYNTIWKGKYMS